MSEGSERPHSSHPKSSIDQTEPQENTNEEKSINPELKKDMGSSKSKVIETNQENNPQPSPNPDEHGASSTHPQTEDVKDTEIFSVDECSETREDQAPSQNLEDNPEPTKRPPSAKKQKDEMMDTDASEEQPDSTTVKRSASKTSLKRSNSKLDSTDEISETRKEPSSPPPTTKEESTQQDVELKTTESVVEHETGVKPIHEQFKDKKKFQSTKEWLQPQYNDDGKLIKKPDELINLMELPPKIEEQLDPKLLGRITGSMLGMAIGDALGAHVEFRPREYLTGKNAVKDFKAGGTWGLARGQFTDDTSMALCLANSLIVCQGFNPYDQLVRYKWWHQKGYMSSTGKCFDIGAATRQSIDEFRHRQREMAKKYKIEEDDADYEKNQDRLKDVEVYCSSEGVAGNGALMRLAPVPLFFHRNPPKAVEYSGVSGQITHGDIKAYDACRYYGALIVAALQGKSKEELIDENFYSKHKSWFDGKELVKEIKEIADGSYKKKRGYDDGIRGGGYIVKALEAALWAFWSTENFEDGVLAAVNLGDDTDTTAAIYGQLAGAYYTIDGLPKKWVDEVYAKEFIIEISKWLQYEGETK